MVVQRVVGEAGMRFSRFWRLFRTSFLLFVVLGVLDWASTVVMFSLPEAGFYEINPIGVFLFGLGWFPPLLAKFAASGFVLFATFKICNDSRWETRVGKWFVLNRLWVVRGLYLFANFFTALVVLNNVYLLARYA